MALVMFSQSFDVALFFSFVEIIFINSFKTLIPKYASSVDAQSVINTGATEFRTIISKTDLTGVLIAYAKSIDRVFYLTMGMEVGYFAFAWGMGWKDLRMKKEVTKAQLSLFEGRVLDCHRIYSGRFSPFDHHHSTTGISG